MCVPNISYLCNRRVNLQCIYCTFIYRYYHCIYYICILDILSFLCNRRVNLLVAEWWAGHPVMVGWFKKTRFSTYSLYQREILVLFMYFTHHKYISCPRTQCVQKSVKPDMETFLPDCPDLHFALDCVQFLTKHTFCGLLKILPGDLGSEFARGYTRECG